MASAPTYKTSWALRYPGYTAKPWIDNDLAEKAAKEWAQEHGFKGAVGGWIYRLDANGVATHAVTQGWFNFWTQRRRQIEDWYTQRLTAFETFDALVHPDSPTYRPTLIVRDSPRDWRVAFLANAYDVYQGRRGDPRRAHTGYAVKPAPEAPAARAERLTSLWLSRVVAGVTRV